MSTRTNKAPAFDPAMFAAFVDFQRASQAEQNEDGGIPYDDDDTDADEEAATAKALARAAKLRVAKAEEAAEDTGANTLYALRHAAVSGYGAVNRYGVGLNREFGEGWPLLRKADGDNAAAVWERVEQERRSFVSLGKSKGLVNPAVHWGNAKRAALLASGHNKRGAVEARPIKTRIVSDASKLYVAILRDAASSKKQPANVIKAGELIAGAIQHLGGDLAALQTQAAKPLPGQAKGS